MNRDPRSGTPAASLVSPLVSPLVFPLLFGLIAAATGMPAGAVDTGNGSQPYQRCAACHLPDGRGIPGAFPPLRDRIPDLASTPEGRRYITMVVRHGLMGSLQVDGVHYQGVMPPQPLNNEEIARTLNYLAELSADVPDSWTPFSESEVTAIIEQDPGLNAHDVRQLRPGDLP